MGNYHLNPKLLNIGIQSNSNPILLNASMGEKQNIVAIGQNNFYFKFCI